MSKVSRIRNFVIISHIDHGKSTLADRFLELTGTIESRLMREQYLDMHPLERERGITIKMQPVRMLWHPRGHTPTYKSRTDTDAEVDLYNNKNKSAPTNVSPRESVNQIEGYALNLIDTPGHADFSYEVSRALAAVEGAILLVDATQGVQSQTLANLQLAQREGLSIVPAVNKIDLPSARVEEVSEELSQLLRCSSAEILRVSAKEGTGVEEALQAVVEKITPPKGDDEQVLRALIFDSKYDPYLGVLAHIRIMEGVVQKGDRLYFMGARALGEAREVGIFLPHRAPEPKLSAGEIGYVATGIKETGLVRVGDTITSTDLGGTRAGQRGKIPSAAGFSPRGSTLMPLPGYQEPNPVVFASVFPKDKNEYAGLRDSLEKLKLEDAAFSFLPEESGALGRGFRLGFLGLLHMEIVTERLRREYGLEIALTRPSVELRVTMRGNASSVPMHAASRLPDQYEILKIEEPWVRGEIITPTRYIGALTSLVKNTRGVVVGTEAFGGERLLLVMEAPLSEIILDFSDMLKSASQGFASFSYSLLGYRTGDLVRLDIAVAGEMEPALTEVVPRERAYSIGRARLKALKEVLAHELFSVSLQAVVEGRVIARETLSALKKDVTGYLYGGDRTRKMKLWKKQKRGKARLRETGRVAIPPGVLLALHQRR